MKIFKLLLIIFSIFFYNIANANNPSDLINGIVNEAALVLKSDDPVESKIIKLNDIAERSVDINGIGMYTLGKHKKAMSEEQKTKYKKLFRSYFLKSFSSRLVDYTNPKINVISEKKINDKYTIVNSILEATSSRPKVKIDWRIYTEKPMTDL
jgi:ABC-type transport system involved in resistance to organic solvents, auxiliary component